MPTRVLIAAGAAAESNEQIPESIRLLIDSFEEILVIAPELPARGRWLISDTDRAREAADQRLQAVLGNLAERGVTARGELGADDPMLAFEDAIAEFDPEHIVVGLRAAEHAGWQERGLLDRLVQRFGIPITVFVL